MSSPPLAMSIDARLERLEGNLRRQRLVIAALGGALALVVFAGASAQFGRNPGPRSPTPSQGEITCRSLTVQDGNGSARILARVQDDGQSSFLIRDRNGSDRVKIQVNADGSSGLHMIDRNGRTRISQAIWSDGTARESFFDSSNSERITAGVDTSNTAQVMCRGAGGNARTVGIGTNQQGCPQGYGPLFQAIYKVIPKDPCAP